MHRINDEVAKLPFKEALPAKNPAMDNNNLNYFITRIQYSTTNVAILISFFLLSCVFFEQLMMIIVFIDNSYHKKVE